jgi:hypothetical protein
VKSGALFFVFRSGWVAIAYAILLGTTGFLPSITPPDREAISGREAPGTLRAIVHGRLLF